MSNAGPVDGFPIALGNRVVGKGGGRLVVGPKGHPKQTRDEAWGSRGLSLGAAAWRAPSAGKRR